MEILFLSFICALSYLIILCKMFSIKFICKTQVFWDCLFTFGMPLLFLGTFSGMATAFISGIIFSITTYYLSILNKSFLQTLPYGKDKDNQKSNGGANTTRSGHRTMCN